MELILTYQMIVIVKSKFFGNKFQGKTEDEPMIKITLKEK